MFEFQRQSRILQDRAPGKQVGILKDIRDFGAIGW